MDSSVPHRRGPHPRLAVSLELVRALVDLVRLPFRILSYLAGRSRLRGELRSDLEREPDWEAILRQPQGAQLPPDRALRIFVCCAEASGEIHARSLVAALREQARAAGAPEPTFSGLGGAGLAADGVELLGRPVERAAMGFDGILRALPYYLGLLRAAAERFRAERPDVFVPVDSPALNVPLAHIAQRYGVRVVHFITPQYWGWAPWRVGSYRRAVDRALTILPFEPAWFARHGVAVDHVGHPLLETVEPSDAREQDGDQNELELVLLPGSRAGVIRRNLPWMLAVVASLRERRGELRVVIVQESSEHEALLRELLRAAGDESGSSLQVTISTGDLHQALSTARAALSVSGTILIDLLQERLPAVVIYRMRRRREMWMYRNLLTTPWFASVNLLAREEVYPEFCFRGDGPRTEVGSALERLLFDEPARERCLAGLERAARALGPPGAARRAAQRVLALAVAPLASSASGPGPGALLQEDRIGRFA